MIRSSLSFLAVAAALAAQQEPKPAVKAPPPPSVDATDAKAAAPVPAGTDLRASKWFSVLELDLGTYFHHEHATGKFPFKNPGKDPVEWRSLLASCQCSKAVITVGDRKYELLSKPHPNTLMELKKNAAGVEMPEAVASIPIGPGEEGEVEVHMEMNGITGMRQASIDIHTTDPETPMMKLRFHATGAQMFVVSPADVNLNQMTWNETRDFQVTVTSPVNKDFNITSMDEAGKDFNVRYEKQMRGDQAVWTINGTYGPVASEVGGGGVLRFHSDLPGSPTFQVRVSAFVKGPLELKPGSFLSLGMIRQGNAKKQEVVFESNDGTDLQATELRFEKLTVDPKYVEVHQKKDGKNLVLELEVSKDVPGGQLLRGDLVVQLNHPLVKEKRILFNGFVR